MVILSLLVQSPYPEQDTRETHLAYVSQAALNQSGVNHSESLTGYQGRRCELSVLSEIQTNAVCLSRYESPLIGLQILA